MARKKLTGFIKAVIVLCSLILIGGTFILVELGLLPGSSSYNTRDIDNYNSKEYPIYEGVFPEQLPQNCKVIDFLYKGNYVGEREQYLELKFNSEEDLLRYVEDMKDIMKASMKREGIPAYYQVDNYKETSFTTLFHLRNLSPYPVLVCFQIDYSKIGLVYRTSWCDLISYSKDELTVIHYSVAGCFSNSKSKFLKRFDVDVSNGYKEYYDLTEYIESYNKELGQ